jgi:acylphosphatase
MQRIEYQVKGIVQGVNFRRWTVTKATALGLTGWVQNTPDGHVQGVALGSPSDIEHL